MDAEDKDLKAPDGGKAAEDSSASVPLPSGGPTSLGGDNPSPEAKEAAVASEAPAAPQVQSSPNQPPQSGKPLDPPTVPGVPSEGQPAVNGALTDRPLDVPNESEPLAGEDVAISDEDKERIFYNKLKMNEEEFCLYRKLASQNESDSILDLQPPLPPLESEDLLYSFLAKKASSIFVETDDLICEQAINILKSMNLQFYVVRLDKLEAGSKIQTVLCELTRRDRLPVIFLKGQLIGSYEDLWFLHFTQLIDYVFDEHHTPYETNFSFNYEMVVIGASAGGVSAALAAAKLGKSVAIVDFVKPTAQGRSWWIGGTSLNEISVTKNLLYTASQYGSVIEGYAIEEAVNETPNWGQLMHDIFDHQKTLNFNIRCQLKEANIERFQARAKFNTSHTVELTFPNTGEKKILTSSVILVATGSRPLYPRFIQGTKEHCYTIDDFFRCAKPPGKTLILTSTHVGLECATILANFNYPVTVLVTGLGALKAPYEDYFDTVLFEYGRIPNTAHLGLCKIGINVDKRTRKILADKDGRTNIKHIFAVGSVVHGWPDISSVTKKGGKFLIQKIYKGNTRDIGLDFIPQRILLPIEYAFIGKTEQEALAYYGSGIKSYDAESYLFGHISNSTMRGYVYLKILCLEREDKEEVVISVHLLCHGAAEMIQGLSILMRNGLTKRELDNDIAFHSLLSEVVSNLKVQPVKTESDVYKACLEKQKLKTLEKTIDEVKPMRRRQKPPVPYYGLDERGSEESLLEKQYQKNKAATAPRTTAILAQDVNYPIEKEVRTTGCKTCSSNGSSSPSSGSDGESSSSDETSSLTSSATSLSESKNNDIEDEEDVEAEEDPTE